jgi:hypothetical protein
MIAQRVSVRKKNDECEEEGGEGEDRYVAREKDKRRVKRCGMKTHLDYTKRAWRGGRSAEAVEAVIQKGQGRTALARGECIKSAKGGH